MEHVTLEQFLEKIDTYDELEEVGYELGVFNLPPKGTATLQECREHIIDVYDACEGGGPSL